MEGLFAAIERLPYHCDGAAFKLTRSVVFYKTYTAPTAFFTQYVDPDKVANPGGSKVAATTSGQHKCQTISALSLDGGATNAELDRALSDGIERGSDLCLIELS